MTILHKERGEEMELYCIKLLDFTKINLAVLLNQTWVRLPVCRQASLLALGCGEGKCSIYCREPSKESRAASA